MMMSDRDKMYLALFAAIFGTAGLVMGTLGLATVVSCGRWATYSPADVLEGIAAKGDFSQISGTQCGPGQWSVIGVLAGIVWLLVMAMVGVVVARQSWKSSDRYFLKDLNSREGLATGQEISRVAGRKALKGKAKTIRPSLQKPQLSDVGRKLGVAQGQEVWMSAEDSVVLFGPPRSGKGVHLVINSILDAPGAVVTTSTRTDNIAATIKLRQKIGPCILFDPQGQSGVESSVKWSPYQGCEVPQKASTRSQALMSASSLGKSTNNAEWAQQARIILQYLMHAAALGEVRIKTFARWCSDPSLCSDAVEILQRHPKAAPGWGTSLKAEVEGDEKTRTSKWLGVIGATEALNVDSNAAALDPGPGDTALDPEEFIASKGTLYLLGSKSDGSAIAPFLIALMDEITNTARRMASKSPSGRLDPPMSLILDEIANLAPWEALPQLMADGGGSGISPFAVFQSPAQIREQWGSDGADALVDSAILQIQLGGSNNTGELRRFTDLLDERKVEERSRSISDSGGSQSMNERKEAVLTVGELRRMPTGYALLMNRNGRPILMKMKPWFKRKDAAEMKTSKAWFENLMKTGGTLENPADADEPSAKFDEAVTARS